MRPILKGHQCFVQELCINLIVKFKLQLKIYNLVEVFNQCTCLAFTVAIAKYINIIISLQYNVSNDLE